MGPSTRSRPRNRYERSSGPFLPVIYEVEGDDTDDAYENDLRSRRSREKARLQYLVLAVASVGVFLRLCHSLKHSWASSATLKSASSASSPTSSPSFIQERRYSANKNGQQRMRPTTLDQIIPTHQWNDHFIPKTTKQQRQNMSHISNAPLFYHISPGSTGSRTLYHASCKSGFPSVHHKSFCISQRRGIRGVADDVVRGVRSHYELLRLYEMARGCCSLWSKGKLRTTVPANGTSAALDHGTHYHNDTHQNRTSEAAQRLCHMPLPDWTTSIASHLTNVLQSGIVGIFDTPYPYLAPQVLDLAARWRTTAPILAMTERDPKAWALSRSRNHSILVCREEYALEGLGASEFDVVGCATRAYDNASASVGERGWHAPLVLHFWDVFQLRSRKGSLDPTFQRGMERQMTRHQELYLPLSQYAPDIFGVHPSTHASNESEPIKEQEVAADMRRHILGRKPSHGNSSNNTHNTRNVETLQSKWRERYRQALTCRGRVDWEITLDTLREYYHLPKTCEAATSRTGQARESNSAAMVPLLPP